MKIKVSELHELIDQVVTEKYNIRKQACKQSDGDRGSYTLSFTSKKGKKYSNCHTSKKNAQDLYYPHFVN